jgi:hypothetical protein
MRVSTKSENRLIKYIVAKLLKHSEKMASTTNKKPNMMFVVFIMHWLIAILKDVF